jgi:flavin-dependent dehydrogenase
VTSGYDVVVAGGGPAGSVCALVLARAGARVLLCERGRRGTFGGGESLPAAARPLLRDLGLWEAFTADGHLPSYGSRSAWGAASLAGHAAVFDPYGHGWLLDRPRFDAFLRAAAVASGAVLSGGVGAESACWTVDATGRTAAVARRLGARRVEDDRAVAVVQRYAAAPGDVDATTLVEAVRDGWWYTARVPSGERVVVYVTDPDLPASYDVSSTRHVFGLVAGCAPLGPAVRVPARAGRLVPYSGSAWLAAGDAAQSFDPLSSQGILTALFGGLAAAEAVLSGDVDAYAARLDTVRATYQRNRLLYYATEDRWPDAPFWRRRRSVPPAGFEPAAHGLGNRCSIP